MNKKLAAIAVAGALALPSVALAQSANVTLYGRANVDMEVVNGSQPNGSNPHVFRVSSNSSRFGLRGTESLGGGLNAIFQVESGVPWDVGGGTLAGRDTFVGLQSPAWGTFKMGLFHLPYDSMHAIFGNVPTQETTILADSALWAQGPQSKATGSFDVRVANSIRYDTPNYSGLTGSVSYSSGENAQHTGVISAAIAYANGPIEAGFAWQQNEDFRAPGLDDNAYTAALGWNFGFLRVAGVYERLEYDTPAGKLKRNLWGASVTVPVGAGTFYASFQRANDGSGPNALTIIPGPVITGTGTPCGTACRVGALTGGSDTGANHISLSYSYAMSKRTLLYTGWTKINNDRNANYIFNINPYTTAIGSDPQGVVLGVSHSF